jgi:hypothetical protein
MQMPPSEYQRRTPSTIETGWIIALLALIPLRSRTIVVLRIGKHLVKTGDLWVLDIPAADTKTRRPLDYPISKELCTRIDLYLERFRHRIPGADRKRAQARGVKFGRPAALTPHQRQEAIQRLADGEAQADVARSFNVSQATISRLAAPSPFEASVVAA